MTTGAPFDSAVLETARIRLTHDYPMAIAACLDALDDDQLWWRPNEEANAIANLVIHLAGSNHFYLEHVFAGRELRRDRDAEFAARNTHTKAQLIDLWQGSVRSTAAVLESFVPERLAEVTEKTGKALTLERILLHVTHHNAIHMGQIVFTTKMLREGAIRDLWKRTRAL
ncbi:MAG TPA: DinB family protein [Vicinamibacterales bacterium]|nr:DinB family protein [Vicinamibacterales bacterium]